MHGTEGAKQHWGAGGEEGGGYRIGRIEGICQSLKTATMES